MQNNYVIYDIVMSVVLIIFNVANLSYIRHYKIHIVDPHRFILIKWFSILYCVTFIHGVGLWLYLFMAKPDLPFEGGIMGFSHVFAMALLTVFIYSISPVFALSFGIPSLLCFVTYVFYSIYRSAPL